MHVEEDFPEQYIKKLKVLLKSLKANDFVFASKTGKVLKESDFEKAFERYCGKKFYPHIVRSHYATKTTEDFLKCNPKPSQDEVKKLFTQIAEKLGHKKFDKKSKTWADSYNVTVHYYIKPSLVKKVLKIHEIA